MCIIVYCLFLLGKLKRNDLNAVTGTMIGSPSGSMHDVQNRIMSPVHGQGTR